MVKSLYGHKHTLSCVDHRAQDFCDHLGQYIENEALNTSNNHISDEHRCHNYSLCHFSASLELADTLGLLLGDVPHPGDVVLPSGDQRGVVGAELHGVDAAVLAGLGLVVRDGVQLPGLVPVPAGALAHPDDWLAAAGGQNSV